MNLLAANRIELNLMFIRTATLGLKNMGFVKVEIKIKIKRERKKEQSESQMVRHKPNKQNLNKTLN